VAKYEVRFSRSAIKEADKLPSNVAERVVPAIDALADNPRPIDCQKLQGEKIFGEFEWVITASSTKSMDAGGFFTFAGFDIAAKYTEASNV
jgi:hypothetical protein